MKRAVTFYYKTEKGILMVSRKDNHNDFGLPGGKPEEDELLVDALIREVKEETGLDIYDLKLKFAEDDGCDYLTFTYTGKVKNEEINTTEPHVVKWGTPEDLLNGSFKEYNKKMLEAVHGLCSGSQELSKPSSVV